MPKALRLIRVATFWLLAISLTGTCSVTKATGEGVNYTAGLPSIRTSPDHGVAFDIAGKDKADTSSFLTALFECIDIFNRRNGYEESRKNPLRKMTPSILANAKDEIIEEG